MTDTSPENVARDAHEPDYKAAMLYHSDRADGYMAERDALSARIADLERQLAEARTDAEQAVAQAYQRACEPVEANFPGTLYASNRTKTIAAILALAPADVLAEVKEWKHLAIAGNLIALEMRQTEARAEAAEAEVERLTRVLDDIQCGRGMFGLDAAVDLDWAVNLARAALKGDTP